MTTLNLLHPHPPQRHLQFASLRARWVPTLMRGWSPKLLCGPQPVWATGFHISKFREPSLGHLKLPRLTVGNVEKAQSLIRSGRYGLVSVTTLHRIHATLMSALNTAVRRGLLPTSPAALVELPRTQRPEMTIWTTTQAQTFLYGAKEHRWHLIYRLLLICGLRRGEALGIQWHDLDLDARALHIHRQLTLVAGQSSIGSPKSAKGVRTVHLDAATITLLETHQKLAGDTSAGAFVFLDEAGTPLDPAMVSRQFTVLVKGLGLPPIQLHDLRHTSASLGLEAGEPITQVSRRLGHSTIAITGDIYTHVSCQAAQEAVDTLARRMRSHLRSPQPV